MLAGVAYRPHILVGEPAETVARFTSENGITELVMGTRGMGAARNLVLGSVANRVVARVKVPVTLIK